MMHFQRLKVFSKYDRQMFTPALKLLLNAVMFCFLCLNAVLYFSKCNLRMTYKFFVKPHLLDFPTWAIRRL